MDRFFNRLYFKGLDSRALAHLKIIAIGSQTKAAIKNHGLLADIMPELYVTEALVETLKDHLGPQDHVLVARAKHARKALIEGIESLCKVTEVQVYESVAENLTEEQIEGLSSADIITFTSASTVKLLYGILGDRAPGYIASKTCVAIGPVTGETLKVMGCKDFVTAKAHTVDGIVECLLDKIGGYHAEETQKK